MGRADLVSVTEDGELDGYDDGLEFRFATPRAFDQGERAIDPGWPSSLRSCGPHAV